MTFGAPQHPISNKSNTHDFIKFFSVRKQGIFETCAPLYEKGLSLQEIADQTGFTADCVRWNLKKGGVSLRTHIPIPFSKWDKSKGTVSIGAYYGFVILHGELLKHPDEFKTLLLIHRLWKSNQSIQSIVNNLNFTKTPPRRGRSWSWKAIKNIIRRFEQKQYPPEVFS